MTTEFHFNRCGFYGIRKSVFKADVLDPNSIDVKFSNSKFDDVGSIVDIDQYVSFSFDPKTLDTFLLESAKHLEVLDQVEREGYVRAAQNLANHRDGPGATLYICKCGRRARYLGSDLVPVITKFLNIKGIEL